MRIVILCFFTITCLSCNSSDIDFKPKKTTSIQTEIKPIKFNDIVQDEPYLIFLEIIADVNTTELEKILNLSIEKLGEKKLNIPSYNLIIDGEYQKVIMIRNFNDYFSAKSFHEDLPDLSKFVLYSYPVSFSNYRLILTNPNGLLEYRNFSVKFD